MTIHQDNKNKYAKNPAKKTAAATSQDDNPGFSSRKGSWISRADAALSTASFLYNDSIIIKT